MVAKNMTTTNMVLVCYGFDGVLCGGVGGWWLVDCKILVSPPGTESASPALDSQPPAQQGSPLKGDLFSCAPRKPHMPVPTCLLVFISLFPLSGLFSPFPLQASPSRKVPVTLQGPHPYDIVPSLSIPTFMFPHHSLALTSSCIYMTHTSG